MDKGALAIARMLIVALVLGAAVILSHPAYRKTFLDIMRGAPMSSPIWISNERYYSAVDFRAEPAP